MRFRFLRVVVAAALLAVTAAAPAIADQQSEDSADFGPMPYYGDCRDAGGRVCVQDPWTGNLTVGPKVIKEGEAVTATFSLEAGGVSFNMPGGGTGEGQGCAVTRHTQSQEVKNAAGRWELQDVPVATSSSCTFRPGPTPGRWATYQVGVTGPCGSQIAVQEGRAQYAACAVTYASDYYGVIPKDDDRFGISGRVTMSNGRGLAGVRISLSGNASKSVLTSDSGDYYFLVKKGTYTVTAGAKVCAVPIAGQGCSPSKTVSVGPSQTVDFRPGGEGVIKGTVYGPNSKPKGNVTVRIVGPDGTTVTSDNQGHYEARVPEGTYVLSAADLSDRSAPEPPTYCADDRGTFPKECRGTVQVDVKPDHIVNWAIKPAPDDIQVELKGTETDKGRAFDATLTLTNPRKEAISDLSFAGSVINVETVLQYDATPVVLHPGTTPDKPTSLAPEQSVTLTYHYDVPAAGEAVLTVNISGKTPDGKKVTGTGLLSVTAGKPVSQEDIDRLNVNGVTNVLSLAREHQRRLNALFAEREAQVSGPGPYTDLQRVLADQYGLPAEFGPMIQTLEEQKAFFRGYGSGFSKEVDKFGKDGGQFLANLAATLEDPVARREAGAALIEAAKGLGPKALENLGYLGDALEASPTDEGLALALQANREMASSVGTALDETYVGAKELKKLDSAAYKANPIKYREEQGAMLGGASATGVKEAALTALSETGMRGFAAVGGKALEAVGLRRIEAAGAEVAEADQTAEAAETAVSATEDTASLQRRIDLAEAATDTIQGMPYGSLLDDAGLAKAGIRPQDAEQIQQIIGDVKKTFGVDLEIGARTSEPLSAGIDGVAKREFIKPKAVSSLDQLLGAEPDFAGRASVFEPKMPADDVLEGLERRNPGITAKLEARKKSQEKILKDWKDQNSSLRTLADASKLRNAEGQLLYKDGVTAIVERPGYTLPPELGKVEGKTSFAYLEQLNEPEFLTARGISPERAAEIKSQLSTFPDSGRTRLLVEERNGTTTFIEGLQNKPIVSDLDLQFVEPKGGWPPGKRGQIETYVNNRMKKIGRFPMHGASDAASDLPSAYAETAAGFLLNTTNPAEAKLAAEWLSRQFKTMARQLRDKAVLTLDEAQRAKLIAKAEEFEKLTPEELLKKYPPGEKIIVFSSTDIRVGSGTGGLR